jgi:hypothetical protein
MTTLHIQHRITDYASWRAAFDRFAPARADAGVRDHRVSRPVDDERFVLIDLDFDDAASATRFLGYLRDVVWAIPANSPALEGAPEARVVERCA